MYVCACVLCVCVWCVEIRVQKATSAVFQFILCVLACVDCFTLGATGRIECRHHLCCAAPLFLCNSSRWMEDFTPLWWIFKLNLQIHPVSNEFKWRVTEFYICGRNYFKLRGTKQLRA